MKHKILCHLSDVIKIIPFSDEWDEENSIMIYADPCLILASPCLQNKTKTSNIVGKILHEEIKK